MQEEYSQYSNEELKQMLQVMGMLVLLESPSSIQLGIDNVQFIVGSKFKGIKFIPYGIHFLNYSIQSENYLFKQSQFLNLNQRNKVIVKQWDSKSEKYIDLPKDQTDKYIQVALNYEFDQFLGPYPKSKFQIWQECSNFITQDTLDRLDPNYLDLEEIHQHINNIDLTILNDQKDSKGTQNSSFIQDNDINQQEYKIGKQELIINYSQIPKNKILQGMTLDQITTANFDKSQIIQEIVRNNMNNNYLQLLAELQYAFIKFILGEDLQSLEQWKLIFITISQCLDLVKIQQNFFLDFIKVVYYQILQFPQNFFIDEISKDSFITKGIYNIVQWSDFNQILKGRIDKLIQMLQKQFDYQVQLELDDQDDAPLIFEEEQHFYKL